MKHQNQLSLNLGSQFDQGFQERAMRRRFILKLIRFLSMRRVFGVVVWIGVVVLSFSQPRLGLTLIGGGLLSLLREFLRKLAGLRPKEGK